MDARWCSPSIHCLILKWKNKRRYLFFIDLTKREQVKGKVMIEPRSKMEKLSYITLSRQVQRKLDKKKKKLQRRRNHMKYLTLLYRIMIFLLLLTIAGFLSVIFYELYLSRIGTYYNIPRPVCPSQQKFQKNKQSDSSPEALADQSEIKKKKKKSFQYSIEKPKQTRPGSFLSSVAIQAKEEKKKKNAYFI